MPAKIVIADDHEIVLDGIRTLVGRAGRDWEICGEARNGQQAIELVKSMKPDLAILDITMPVKNGLEAARQIVKMHTGAKLLVFTMHESDRLAVEVRDAGADGFVLKSQASRDLIRAIDQVLAGGQFFGGKAGEPSPEVKAAKPRESPLR